MRLDLSHVFLDGQLFAAEQTRLLPFVHVERGESVDEHVCAAIVIISFDDDIGHRGWLLLFLYLVMDG